jgi:hypothetical protein
MDCTFEQRKERLESECVVKMTQFSACLERLKTFMVPFVQSLSWQKHRDYAEKFVAGLCSDLARKNAESIAYHFELERKTIQHFVGESEWGDACLRAELATQIGIQLGEADGVLIFDPSSFVKSGKESVGVARQWCGRLGKVDNCQVGLYLGYASSKGHALVDGELYLPKDGRTTRNACARQVCPKISGHTKNVMKHFWNCLRDLGVACHTNGLPVTTNWAGPSHFAGHWTRWVSNTCWPSPAIRRSMCWTTNRPKRKMLVPPPSVPAFKSCDGRRLNPRTVGPRLTCEIRKKDHSSWSY